MRHFERHDYGQNWPDIRREVETSRFGPFCFQPGIDRNEIAVPLVRVEEAQQAFCSSPLAGTAADLEREVIAASVFGTDSIEGGQLTEEETAQALELSPEQVQEVGQRRVRNISDAYRYSKQQAAQDGWALSADFIRQAHLMITLDLPDERNVPGMLRNNPKDVITRVGDQAHGGRYKPPQYGGDVELLLNNLVDWHADLQAAGYPALIRAPLVHYYYELIHPFWDGNGRTGRVIEAALLQQDGFRYAPFAQANYYHANIDLYFSLFNFCRRARDKGEEHPNQAFVVFFLQGMHLTIRRLQSRLNRMTAMLLFRTRVEQALATKNINKRQKAIVNWIADHPHSTAKELRAQPFWQAIYANVTARTAQRDLNQLIEEEFLIQQDDGALLTAWVNEMVSSD